eukprot:TRINITY_DN10899_c0_g6_i1.p1 TRINITY_DN10899_c0_g6~~TRINITY_DN10899_c0_g6_i1.p1  ORF type:complete len:145 (+),score=20.29 TRINITY_DN10899_c0_g6_i1:41-475(+)
MEVRDRGPAVVAGKMDADIDESSSSDSGSDECEGKLEVSQPTPQPPKPTAAAPAPAKTKICESSDESEDDRPVLSNNYELSQFKSKLTQRGRGGYRSGITHAITRDMGLTTTVAPVQTDVRDFHPDTDHFRDSHASAFLTRPKK